MKKIFSYSSIFLLFLIVLYLCFFNLVDTKSEWEQQTEIRNKMGLFLQSRMATEQMEFYQDENMMHGLKYFFFKSNHNDIKRLINWLRLKKQSSIPDYLVNIIPNKNKHVDWKFDWDNAEIFITYYCNSYDLDWSFDLVFVDNVKVVYATTGYVSDFSKRVDNSVDCENLWDKKMQDQLL